MLNLTFGSNVIVVRSSEDCGVPLTEQWLLSAPFLGKNLLMQPSCSGISLRTAVRLISDNQVVV